MANEPRLLGGSDEVAFVSAVDVSKILRLDANDNVGIVVLMTDPL